MSTARAGTRRYFKSAGATAALETICLRAVAVLAAAVLFGVFVTLAGANPFDVFYQMARGSFGSLFSLKNTLLRAAPLMLTALATAVPARLGLMMIGGEGALVAGGLAAATVGLGAHGLPPFLVTTLMVLTGAMVGGAWLGVAGALRAYRGVNETISGLLLTYIAIALLNHIVEGPLKDPTSLNKPSTRILDSADMLQSMPGTDLHWGFFYGVVACVAAYLWMDRSVFGFGARIVGGNLRAGRLCGLPAPRMIVQACVAGGAAAGLAGMVEVAAVHGRANASLVSGYGYTGILVSFLARHHPLAIVPVAIALGGIGASSGLLQRADGLPDATVNVLQGILFLVVLASETLYGRFFRLEPETVGTPPQALPGPELDGDEAKPVAA